MSTPVLLQPLGARCLIKPIEPEEISQIIKRPDSDKTKSDQGFVVAMGTEPYGHGKIKDPNAGVLVQLKVGDKVLFSPYTGAEFHIGGEYFRVMLYDEVLVILNQTPAPTVSDVLPPSLEGRGTKKNARR
jgi:chaperonin GroES